MAQGPEEEPILDVVLDELQHWFARGRRHDAQTVLSMNPRWVLALTLFQIALLSIIKITTGSWTAAQSVCLIPLLAGIMVRADRPRRTASTERPLPFNYATTIPSGAFVTLLVIPFVLIIGIPKASGIDLLSYAIAVATTLVLVRIAWRTAVRRHHAHMADGTAHPKALR